MYKIRVSKRWLTIYLLGLIFHFSVGQSQASPRSALVRSICGQQLAELPVKDGDLDPLIIFENSGVFKPVSQWPDGLGMIATPEEVPLNLQNVALAYALGMFWWRQPGTTNFGWYSESERGILRLKDLRIEREIEKALIQLIRDGGLITINSAFDTVIEKCVYRPGAKEVPWLSPELRAIFKELHRWGYAHSFEIWGPANELTGQRPMLAATYGTFINGHYGGESIYTNRAEGAHFGKLVTLVGLLYTARLATGELDENSWIDIQTTTEPYKKELGAVNISRAEFNQLLKASNPSIPFYSGLVPGQRIAEGLAPESRNVDMIQIAEDIAALRQIGSERARSANALANERASQNVDPEALEAKRLEKERRRAERLAKGLPVSAPKQR